MSFVKGLTGWTVVLVGATAITGAASAQSKTKAPAPTPVIDRGPSNVDLVNKALNPGRSSNPDVPLPHPDLAGPAAKESDTVIAPQIYGRQEQGGGVLGLRVPIPADRKL
jgi:hypothetical protein